MPGLTVTFENTSGQQFIVNFAHVGIQGSGGGGGGAATFTALTDTPADLVAGKYLKVNAAGDAIEQTDAPADTGATTHYFDGVPIDATGADGDSGVNKVTGSLYLKVAGAWVLQIHLTPRPLHDALSDQANTIAGLVTANTKLSEGGGPPVGDLNDAHLDDAGKLYIHDGSLWQLVADYATAAEVNAAITAAIAGVTIDHVNSARFGFAQRLEDVAIAGMRYIVDDILDALLGAEFAGKQNHFVIKDAGDNLTFVAPVLGEVVPLTLEASNSDTGIEKTIFWTGTEWGRITDGYANTVTGAHAHAHGRENTASGANSTALGESNEASGENAVASGSNSRATAPNARAHGSNVVASGEEADASGRHTSASGAYSGARGNYSEAPGQFAQASGNEAEARSSGSFAHGWAVTCKNAWATLVGKFGVMGDPETLFGIAHSASNAPPTPDQQAANEDLNLVMKVDRSGNQTIKGKYYIAGQAAAVGFPDDGAVGDVARKTAVGTGATYWQAADAMFTHLKGVTKVGQNIRFTGMAAGVEHTIDIVDTVGGDSVLHDGTIRIVDGVPAASLGNDGDAAIDPANGKIYKKAAGAWAERVDVTLAAELASAVVALQSLVNLKADLAALNAEIAAREAADLAQGGRITTLENAPAPDAPAFSEVVGNIDLNTFIQIGRFVTGQTTGHPAVADSGGMVTVERNAGGDENFLRQTYQPTASADTYTRYTADKTANPIIWLPAGWEEVNERLLHTGRYGANSVTEPKLSEAVRAKLNAVGGTISPGLGARSAQRVTLFEGEVGEAPLDAAWEDQDYPIPLTNPIPNAEGTILIRGRLLGDLIPWNLRLDAAAVYAGGSDSNQIRRYGTESGYSHTSIEAGRGADIENMYIHIEGQGGNPTVYHAAVVVPPNSEITIEFIPDNAPGTRKVKVFESDVDTSDASTHRVSLTENGVPGAAAVNFPTSGYNELVISIDTGRLTASPIVADNPGRNILTFPGIDFDRILGLDPMTIAEADSNDWTLRDKIAKYDIGLTVNSWSDESPARFPTYDSAVFVGTVKDADGVRIPNQLLIGMGQEDNLGGGAIQVDAAPLILEIKTH